MDPTQIKKIQAMNSYKRRQFLDNLYFYSLTILLCSLFCGVTLCLPYLSSMVVFFLVHISSLIPVLLSSKLLFFIGNLIIFVLIVNSRILSSDSSSTSDVYYDEYIQTKIPQIPTPEGNNAITFEKHVENVGMTGEDGVNTLDLKGKGWVKKATKARPAAEEEDNMDGGEEQSLLSSSDDDDELNKRADDFIARVNRHRRFELGLLQYGGSY